jgi:hypothetical protein
LRALLLALLLVPAARAEDLFPLGAGSEWTYLAFEDQGARGLGFSHKLSRKVLETRTAAGGTFYWLRESAADPDVGPNAEARFATDLLKLPFKAPHVVADEVYFKDGENVYLKLRVEAPGFRSKDEFVKQCELFEADKEPYKLRANPTVPLTASSGQKWEGVASKSRVAAKGPWTSEAMRRQWPEAVTVEDEAPGRSQKTIYVDGFGPVSWSLKTPKGKSYFELAQKKFGNEGPPPAASPELTELRLRGILGPDQEEVRPEDLQLLAEMRRAEKEGGIEFLKSEAGTVRPYSVERKVPGGHLELLFNARGFETYRQLLSQAAIHDFEVLGIQLKYVFYLVDGGERPLFDEEGMLTQNGTDVVYAMRKGAKAAWKLPGQDLPPNGPKEKPDDAAALALLAKGFEEISGPELHYIQKASKCSVAQLQSQYTLKKIDKDPKRPRWFLHKDDSLMSYVGVFRAGDALKEQGGPGSLIGDQPLCQ